MIDSIAYHLINNEIFNKACFYSYLVTRRARRTRLRWERTTTWVHRVCEWLSQRYSL